MSKIKTVLAALLLVPATTFAGGLLTNTNQNASFLRQMSQHGIIDITGLYYNPAGTAFLSNGWHLSLNVQSAYQHRDITTTFPLFGMNTATLGNAKHEFCGKAVAPVIPSFQLSYNHDKWSVNVNFALGGGGGKCEFKQGLGSFEALYAGRIAAQLPGMVNEQIAANLPGLLAQGLVGAGIPVEQATALAGMLAPTATVNSSMTNYSMNSYMKGRQYYFGLQLGATYKVTDNFAVFGGLRGVYASCNYNGYVQDVAAGYTCSYDVPANASLGFPGTSGQRTGSVDLSDRNLTLNCDQTGFGITPIIGFDWRINEHWNVAAKCEFKTKMRLKNSTEMNDYAKQQVAEGNTTLGQFADGKKVAQDIPAIVALGAQYSPIKAVRLNAGFTCYMDDAATSYGNKQDLIEKNTWELSAGAEYDATKWLTVSASWQRTKYGLSDAYMNDLSFNVSSHALGLGFRVKASQRCNIDFGYMHNFYEDRSVDTQTAAGKKTDLYKRTNDVFGIGVNLAF